MKDIPEHLWHKSYIRVGDKKTGGPNLRLLRLDPNLPSNTVTAFIFNKFAHPFEDRYITPREAARLQQFPDSHIFQGPITSIQLQIGNAVPVGLAEAVAGHIHTSISEFSHSKNKAVSLFSGAGGMDLGFSKFFHIEIAVEIDKHASNTLARNFKNVTVINGDISEINFAVDDKLNNVDLVFGGPPCQPFSYAGKQKGISDPRGSLVTEFLRAVSELKPRAFVLENVPGLLTNAKGGALKFIIDESQKIGYTCEYFILNATDYGVPQSRKRLFIIGQPNENFSAIGAPNPTHSRPGLQGDLLLHPTVTVGDAFKDLPPAKPRN
ncbi:DNA (cytosine-5-)-methyltransferase [Rothia nasimurium]|uniref:DNA (cytosine-5-)-methyltransferase n=1 Tax=Rothia nasimurium TaxID=85336 RepID=UPI003BA06214